MGRTWQGNGPIEHVQRKLRKRKTPKTIAEELDEPMENVEQICAAVMQCGLDADLQVIYGQMQYETL